MYSLRQLKRLLENPKVALVELNRIYHRRFHRWEYNEAGIDVFQRDWDTLVILDACRYDMFEAEADLPGETRKVRSRGTSTIEFLRGNVDGRTLHDTVYVTANPQLHKHRRQIDTSFHAERHVWNSGGWNEEKGTVLPEAVTEAALDAASEFPDKRLVVHYLQPHQPFIDGETDLDTRAIARAADDPLEFWNQVIGHSVTLPEDELWEAYVDNLHAVLPDVERLLESIDGRTVVTADHGELIAEKTRPIPVELTGHLQGIYVPALVEVPWHVYEDGPRRTVRADPPTRDRSHDDMDQARDRLEDLGYVT